MRDTSQLQERIFKFVVDRILFLQTIKSTPENINNKRQLNDAATSSGANYEESQAGSSVKDSKNKIANSLKKMRETNFWLRLFVALKQGDEDKGAYLVSESTELKKILGSIFRKLPVLLYFIFSYLLSLIFDLVSYPSVAQIQVIRGPYLQMPTSSSIIVRWRTDSATTSRVDFSLNPSLIPATTVVDSTVTTEHKIQLTGLSPFTAYYYAAGTISQLLSGPDALHWFKTSPTIGTIQPVRIWAIGDFGNGSTTQKKVRDAFTAYNGSNHLDAWLWLGDNAYGDGTDEQYQTNVFDTTYSYGNLFKHYPFMPTPGNHDYNSICQEPICIVSPANHTGPYYDIIDVPTNGEAGGVSSGYELYYSFDYANIHFISLNSEIGSAINPLADWLGILDDSNFTGSPLYSWLINDLSSTQQKWIIAYWHQPPYTKGSHSSDDAYEMFMKKMRENIVPILEQYGVDVVLNGHSHNYERSYLINGYYGDLSSWDSDSMLVDSGSGKEWMGEPYNKYTYSPENNTGTVYMIGGNSGKTTDPPPQLNHPAMYYGHGCDSCAGSIVIDVNGNELNAHYVTAWGAVYDEFTIFKIDSPSVLMEIPSVALLHLSPNPCGTATKIRLPRDTGIQLPVTLEVYDGMGKRVIKNILSSAFFEIPCKEMEQGIYFIRLIDRTGSSRQGKFLVE